MKKAVNLLIGIILLMTAFMVNAYATDVEEAPTMPPEVEIYWDGGIEIIPPDKTTYIEGEILDLTGFEVYGTSGEIYTDGTSKVTYRKEIQYYTVDLENTPLTVDNTTVTVTGIHPLMQTTVSGTFEITVLPENVESIDAPNQAEKDYNISYYIGGIGNVSTADKVQPYGNKITYAAGLEALSMWDTELREEIIAKYDDAFFKEKFLIVISWVELQDVRLKLVGEVSVGDDDFSIVISEREYNEEVTSVIAPYCAILEVPISEDDKALMLDGKYFYVPPICVLPIYVPAPEVDTESGMVAYGSEITISPVNNNSIAYSINGSEFVYEKEAVKLSITEDTELVVKSRVDNPDSDPDAQYMIDENTYMYTIDPTTIPVDGKYEVTFKNITYISVYTDSSMSEIAEAPYKTTDGKLYFFIAEAPGSGTLTLTSSCGTIECLGEMSYGYKYLLSGVTENTVVSANHYTGPELEISTATLNADGTVTTKVFAGYANASAPDGTVIVGAYDESGVLLSVKMYDCMGATATLVWTDIPTVTTFKAMWWDSVNTMTPVTESDVISIDMVTDV